MGKKRGLILGILFLFIITFMSFSSAADSCSITTACPQTDKQVMRLSDSTNAHGELYSEGNYDYYLCCNFAGTHSCEDNIILRLSDVTNAHAESPVISPINYNYPVCFGDLSCTTTTDSNCDNVGSSDTNYFEIVSLSAETNAHIGGFDDYPYKICCTTENLSECTLNSASWSETSVENGTTVNLNVGASNCDGYTLSFEIFEDDLIGDDNVETNPENVIIESGSAQGIWVSEWQEDAEDPPEYYFKATITNGAYAGDYIESSKNDDDELKVYWIKDDGGGESYCGDGICNTDEDAVSCPEDCSDGLCSDIIICSSYTESTNCNADTCDVADTDCSCEWDTDTAQCNEVCGSEGNESVCGNNVRDTGEVCDGTDLGGYTCSSFDDFPGGTLLCNSQCDGFNSSQCTGYTCDNDGTQETGESCDTEDLGGFQCSDFDEFTSGILTCSNACEFVTDQCYGGTVYDSGKCTKIQESSDTCEDDGYLSYSWTATWEWNERNNFSDPNGDGDCSDIGEEYVYDDGACHLDPDRLFAQCVDGSNTVECPSQIPLPFFNWYNLIITILIIAGIYWLLKKVKLKKKSVKKKKPVKKKKSKKK